MKTSDTPDSIWWCAAFAAVAVLVGVRPSLAQPTLDRGLQECVDRLPEAQLRTQLLCLQRLPTVGPAAAIALPTLSALLIHSNGTTDHNLVVAVLDVFRSLGPDAAPAAETLSTLLQHRSKLYRERDKAVVPRLRAYIMVTLGDVGVPTSALPLLLDSVAHVDERMSPLEVGAAVRAVGSLGPRGRAFAPYVIDVIFRRSSEEEFSLERYESHYPAAEATTIQLEAVRCLGRISSGEDQEVVEALQEIAGGGGAGVTDPRVVREAERVLDRIRTSQDEGRSRTGAARPAVARHEPALLRQGR